MRHRDSLMQSGPTQVTAPDSCNGEVCPDPCPGGIAEPNFVTLGARFDTHQPLRAQSKRNTGKRTGSRGVPGHQPISRRTFAAPVAHVKRHPFDETTSPLFVTRRYPRKNWYW